MKFVYYLKSPNLYGVMKMTAQRKNKRQAVAVKPSKKQLAFTYLKKMGLFVKLLVSHTETTLKSIQAIFVALAIILAIFGKPFLNLNEKGEVKPLNEQAEKVTKIEKATTTFTTENGTFSITSNTQKSVQIDRTTDQNGAEKITIIVK